MTFYARSVDDGYLTAGSQKLRITMTEIESGAGHNDGPELRLLVQSNQIMDLRTVMKTFTSAQRDIFAAYADKPSDYEPLLGRRDGYRFNDEWTFAAVIA